MSTARLIRGSGLAAMLGGVLWTALWAIEGAKPVAPPGGYRPGYESFNLWSGVAVLFMVVGLAGAYLKQMRRLGWIGHAGFALLSVGVALMAGGRLGQVLGVGNTWVLVILGAFAFTIGHILFGIATVRARVLPLSSGLLLTLAGFMFFLTDPENRRAFFALPLGAAWIAIGYALWLGSGEPRGAHQK